MGFRHLLSENCFTVLWTNIQSFPHWKANRRGKKLWEEFRLTCLREIISLFVLIWFTGAVTFSVVVCRHSTKTFRLNNIENCYCFFVQKHWVFLYAVCCRTLPWICNCVFWTFFFFYFVCHQLFRFMYDVKGLNIPCELLFISINYFTAINLRVVL